MIRQAGTLSGGGDCPLALRRNTAYAAEG